VKRTKDRPWPALEYENAKRLPRAPSYSEESDRDSGRCLIALRFTGHRFRKLILVRNCYTRTATGEIMVENTRDLMPKRAKRTKGAAVAMSRLARHGFTIEKPPFMLTEPMHNCMAELREDEFARVWKINRDTAPTAMEAQHLRSANDTPMRRLLAQHWKAHRVHEGWSATRVRKLCAMWDMTPFELAEMIQWAPGNMEHYLTIADQTDVMKLPGPVAVWFYFLENFRFGVSVFPTISDQPMKAAS